MLDRVQSRALHTAWKPSLPNTVFPSDILVECSYIHSSVLFGSGNSSIVDL